MPSIPAIGQITDPTKVRVALIQGQQIVSAPATALSDAVGLPAGGSTGQVLTKSSATDYDTTWANTGNFSGPASATGGNLVAFDGATGKLGKDSGKKPADFATAAQGDKADTAVQPGGLGDALSGHIYGFTLANNAVDATNDIDIAIGRCTSDGADPVLMTLAAALTKRLDAAWAAGSNQGGLDTGAVADGTYHVHLISASDGGTADVLFSASATAPTMPTGYTRSRRIGSIVRQSGSIRGFRQLGDTFYWSPTADLDVSVANQGTTAVNRTLTLPTGIVVEAMLTGNWFNANATLSILTPGLSGNPMTSYSNSTSGLWSTRVMTNTSAQISTKSSATASSQNFRIDTLGWIDTRGRLA